MENVWEHEVIVLAPMTSLTANSVVFRACEEQSNKRTAVRLQRKDMIQRF